MKRYLPSALAGVLLMAGPVLATADTVVIAPEQETVIREYVQKEPAASIKLPGVELSIGSTLPETVELHTIDAPEISYRYVVVDDRTVLVDPSTRQVVRILD